MYIQKPRDWWKSKRVFVTGHTGFKGVWLCQYLSHLGAEVIGFSDERYDGPIRRKPIQECIGDINNSDDLRNALMHADPHFIFHLAAQSIVSAGYDDPLRTFKTNIIGTANLLESARNCKNLKGVICVTSDKSYQNQEQIWPYSEKDRIGGIDPYSASKSAAEHVIASYDKSFFRSLGLPICAVRAGNVIGGGDFSKDRIFPDIVRAVKDNKCLTIRNPLATRPWQHVSDCLLGYITLAEYMLIEPEKAIGPWNFGPETNQLITVKKLLEVVNNRLEFIYKFDETNGFHEHKLLQLDTTKAQLYLNWKPRFNMLQAIEKTVEEYSTYLNGDIINLDDIVLEQLYGKNLV